MVYFVSRLKAYMFLMKFTDLLQNKKWWMLLASRLFFIFKQILFQCKFFYTCACFRYRCWKILP